LSIPERLWRVVKGHWVRTGDRLDSLEAQAAEAAAYQELADALRHAPRVEAIPLPDGPRVLPPPAPPTRTGRHDPLEACYELLKLQPEADLSALEKAYQERLAEIRPERYPEGSPERSVQEGRRAAVEAAYEKLRDALNPTETRFERLEF
jgi:flagellar biosynthesis/type III secretory pathway protein FliH